MSAAILTKWFGPTNTRGARIKAWAGGYGAIFRMRHPFTQPAYVGRAPKNKIMTGYGAEGPQFDLRWHNATAD